MCYYLPATWVSVAPTGHYPSILGPLKHCTAPTHDRMCASCTIYYTAWNIVITEALHMFSCLMKLAMLLCLKYLGRISLAKRCSSNTRKLLPSWNSQHHHDSHNGIHVMVSFNSVPLKCERTHTHKRASSQWLSVQTSTMKWRCMTHDCLLFNMLANQHGHNEGNCLANWANSRWLVHANHFICRNEYLAVWLMNSYLLIVSYIADNVTSWLDVCLELAFSPEELTA